MKLISKTLIYYLLVSLPLLVVAGLLSYFLIKAELRDGTDETLLSEKVNAEKLIRSLKTSNTIYLSSDSLSNIKLSSGSLLNPDFNDTLIFDQEENENIGARMLKSHYTFNGNIYQITLVKSTMDEEELLEGILATFTLVIGFLIVSFVIVNWLLSKTLWKPFYSTLLQLNKYEIKNHEHHHFNPENTIEFNQLNDALNKMMDKIYSDFIQQKEFTENASHEMQTPLAVVKANLSLLMQSPNLKEDEMNRLQTIENTIKKLSSLNKALILLSKIENNQFNESDTISIKAIVSRITDNFAEVIQSKNINLDLNLSEDILVKMNPTLAEILITNILQNAIRHNNDNGKITIESKGNQLIISNTGMPLSIPEEQLFMRFKKNDASKESLGLGLAIVKSICKSNNINIGYSFQNSLHTFTLNF
ncbi:MAG: HAMP domain-containing sensor histidine kinase [Bacteroidota bacterium]|nr:HAMP domain-containing sensor histidine kinase [Bacteroidota bacterium]